MIISTFNTFSREKNSVKPLEYINLAALEKAFLHDHTYYINHIKIAKEEESIYKVKRKPRVNYLNKLNINENDK
ncbi:unnamed protein product, partial [Trichogramma brassicae]